MRKQLFAGQRLVGAGWLLPLLLVLSLFLSACTIDANGLAGAALSKPSQRPMDPTCYWIESKLTGFVLDIDQGNPTQGTKLIVWPKNSPPSANQLWFVNGDGTVASKLNGFVVDIPGANQAQGQQLVVWPRNAPVSPNQQWELVDQGNGYVAIRSRLQGYVLDVHEANPAQGTAVIDWPQNNPIGDNQLWRLQSAPSADCNATPPPTSVPTAAPTAAPTPTVVPAPPSTPIQTTLQMTAPNPVNLQCPGPHLFVVSVVAADMSQGAPAGRLTIACEPGSDCPIEFVFTTDGDSQSLQAPGPVSVSIPTVSFGGLNGRFLQIIYTYTPADPTRFAPSSETRDLWVNDTNCLQ